MPELRRSRPDQSAFIVIVEGDYERLRGTKVSFEDLLLSSAELDGPDLKRDPGGMSEVSL